MRRAVGDFSTFAVDDTFFECVYKLNNILRVDLLWLAYVRKSNPLAETQAANYLGAQLDIPTNLQKAGVDGHLITLVSEDIGKSGALSGKFRKGLQRMIDYINNGIVGVVVAIDVGRLFRDSTDIEPSKFAALAALHNLHVITKIGGKWMVLDMKDDTQNRLFRQLAQKAADERKEIRARTMQGREQMVLRGGPSGAPVPFGWAVTQKISRHESADGIEHTGHLYVYEPHAIIRLEIMWLSLRPDIKSLRQLRDALVKKGIKIIPFERDIASYCFTRSVLCRAHMVDNGVSRAVQISDAFTPSVQMLKSILTEPLSLGDKLYGSGEHGRSKARRLERIAKEQGQRSDHMLRENRELIGVDLNLAICKTADEIEMCYRVFAKWSPIDIQAARDTQYQSEPKRNEQCIRKIGRPVGSSHRHLNDWAGIVYCGKHGRDSLGALRRDHVLRHYPERGEWTDSKAYDAGDAKRMCTCWGDSDRLGRILNYHLWFHIYCLVQKDEGFIRNVIEEKQQRQLHLLALKAEFAGLEAEKKRQNKRLDEHERRWTRTMTAEEVIHEADEFFDDNIKPINESLKAKREELSILENQEEMSISQQTEEEIRRDIETAVFDEQKLSDEKRRELIHTFVEHVIVIAPDNTGEALIYFKWAATVTRSDGGRVTDTLIASKSLSKDNRPWTPEEDTAIVDMYPKASGSSRDALLARLQPGRKIDAIIKRMYELKVRRPLRSKEWIQECRELEKTWGYFHPDVLYLCVPDSQLDSLEPLVRYDLEGSWQEAVPTDVMVMGEGRREEIDLPDRVRHGLQAHREYLHRDFTRIIVEHDETQESVRLHTPEISGTP